MGRRILRRVAACLVVVTTPVALAACRDEQQADALEIVTGAASETTAAGSARFEARSTLEISGQLELSLKLEESGVEDFESGDFEAVIRMSGPVDSVIELRGNAETEYWRISELDLPPGKRWVRLDVDSLDLDSQNFAVADPTDGLNFLRGLTKDPREVGRDEVRGTSVTHYGVTFDLQEQLEQLRAAGEEVSPEFTRMSELAGPLFPDEVPADVWIDDDGLVRRFEIRIAFEAFGADLSSTTRMDFYDFGTEVEVRVPPEDETIPFEEVSDELNAFFGTHN